MLSLPDFVIVHLIAFLRRCFHALRWPEGFTLNYMALLPKPEADKFRTIGKTPMLYIIWGICRKPRAVKP